MQRGKAGLDLQRVVGDGSLPAVGAGDGLIETAVEVGDLRPSAFVDSVVQIGQADLDLDADRLAPLDQVLGDLADLAADGGVRLRPRKGLET
jgi:hypothetical protein